MSKKERIEAGFMISSYLETVGFNNGIWEFNYQTKLTSIDDVNKIWIRMIHDYLALGGSNLNISKMNASDDTIMTIATGNALLNNNNYKEEYIKILPLLKDNKRASGITLLQSLEYMKRHTNSEYVPSDKKMGGNGASMRTFPIGIIFSNEEEIIVESIKASKITHNYYIGYLGGVVSALFCRYALDKVDISLWIDRLLNLYNDGIFYKYCDENEVDDFMKYWKRYKETRWTLLKKKDYQSDKRYEILLSYNPSASIQNYVNKNLPFGNDIRWDHVGITGVDSCIFAYDCLLLTQDFASFMMLVSIHPGDNDTTAMIGGFWYGLFYGYNGFDKHRIKELEFYKELNYLSKKFIK
jgi:ADP-ribosylglycohydrolase